MTPKRIQRKRTTGWRAPMCSCGCGKPARYVGRGTKWGNPYKVVEDTDGWKVIDLSARGYLDVLESGLSHEEAQGLAVFYFKDVFKNDWFGQIDAEEELGGHDLMCWCPLDAPCHADVLLEYANAGSRA